MATDYHVTYTDTRPDITNSGRLAYVKDVHFVIDTEPALGHEDTVTVSDTMYNADNVRALIDEKVSRIKAVAAI